MNFMHAGVCAYVDVDVVDVDLCVGEGKNVINAFCLSSYAIQEYKSEETQPKFLKYLLSYSIALNGIGTLEFRQSVYWILNFLL